MVNGISSLQPKACTMAALKTVTQKNKYSKDKLQNNNFSEVNYRLVAHFASFTLSIRPSSDCNFLTTGATLSDELQPSINTFTNAAITHTHTHTTGYSASATNFNPHSLWVRPGPPKDLPKETSGHF